MHSGKMTVQVDMGIRRLHTLPVLCGKVDWASDLKHPEFTLASEMVHLNGMHKLKYTSLRDIIPCSPTNLASPRREPNWCTNVSIRNNLVKHAALAYLQPMVTENNNDDDFFVRCLPVFSNNGLFSSSFKDYILTPIDACIGFFTTQIVSNLIDTFDYLAGQFGRIFRPRASKK
ncbi:uncharacterized protein LOC131051369 [Cryptomeria japonica]|uniref:uncharacterized protein LOC131051369 n=1 Tax=Cryptomeria japonica TaxID=3369 RepID=UPI0025ACCE23|nr:uncharacterized protein LOC131051369 [Cryptomeria japonica]